MSIYRKIYYNLCESRKTNITFYGHKSGFHRHHIIPVHDGGLDVEDNITYLTVREHQIAHFLLWKINKNPNDLRSMHMLGAKLTPQQRRITGIFCRDNNIGFHRASEEQKRIWRYKGLTTQKRNYEEQGEMNSYYYWAYTKEGRKRLASMGGKSGAKSQMKNKIGIHDPENFKKHAILGGKAIKGMICVTNGTHRTRIHPEKLEEYLAKGYRKGFTLFS